ncbi:MAG: phenylalanine--tRNA ligase subunit alpha [Candidatus Enteromonas sp.]|jgi:phenylalanyl-tRNA synthetase alpha chain|nr:phenylalanine--tRNA ligase subunit alpha [Bacilli bacterium]MBQ4182005.1 phenylalanine--tRNA ligase subunit alpha [Bacilli bacterium]MCR5091624.1 phenylalanine--tRNA ligase subunit alpha [Bacilli bacterium]MEE3401691.1 phenylalanine--tRNA ligase subunit alpha [Candidatus Enteromonas sp.]MEE3426515.1 phenylalanine--tRNA ligase subunit alpha [Candidatus Enteromonas sp.]
MEISEITERALKEFGSADTESALEEAYNKYLSKKGEISQLMSQMGKLPKEEKASFGKAVNDARNAATAAYQAKRAEIEKKKLAERLEKEAIDITLPAKNKNIGHINPYYAVIDEVTDIFLDMGYQVVEGRDVETDRFNFELLNVPKDHPARDMQDTYYLEGSDLLLRTQTSAAQAHTMLEKEVKTPIRMISPGKAYRRDDDDMTHSHQFAQIEALVVDHNISMANLKATLELFAKKMFGEKREIRLRSSYFPFTEPSVEVDVSCFACGGKGCKTCKGTGWIEILGAGMVNPKVLEACGYDPKEWSGFAFGVGVERVAMLRYGIDDIRRIYTDDVRFLKDYIGK